MPVSSSCETTIAFTFDCSSDHSEQFALPFPPFNSGTWTFVYVASTKMISIKSQNVTSTLPVDSIEFSHGAVTKALDMSYKRFPRFESQDLTPGITPELGERAEIRMRVKSSTNFGATWLAGTTLSVAKTNSHFFNSLAPNDVVLYFPRSKRELWTSSAVLRAASPHFATFLGAGYKEDETAERQSSAADASLENNVGDDSDEEVDLAPLEGAALRTSSKIPAGVKEIVVDYAAYTTYRALLTYVHSGHLEFSLLNPPRRLSPHTLEEDRPEAKVIPRSARAPFAASSKSIFNLAHFLEMAELQHLALTNFRSQLNVDKVLYQLTTEIAVHDVVREALIEYAISHWAAVRKTPLLKELQKVEVLESLANPLLVTSALAAIAEKCG